MVEAGSIIEDYSDEMLHNSIQDHYVLGERFPHITEQNIRMIDILLEGRTDGKDRNESQTSKETAKTKESLSLLQGVF